MINLTTAILAIKSDAVVEVIDNDINLLTWRDGNPTNITNEQILAKQIELQAEYDALNYARARELAYPITKEFIEAYTEKEIGGDTTKWDAYVVKYNKVRSDNQKP
jgi:UDP-galactopyranose mutase